jgi:hypothetical protein
LLGQATAAPSEHTMADDLAGFGRKLDQVADAIAARTLKRTLDKVGAQGKRDLDAAVSATLGYRSMSNWRRGRPIPINGRYNLRSDTSLEVLPGKRAAGPLRVLEDGRKAGMSKARRGRPSRNVGATAGKGTWTAATKAMEQSLPRVAAKAVHDELGKIFGKG